MQYLIVHFVHLNLLLYQLKIEQNFHIHIELHILKKYLYFYLMILMIHDIFLEFL